MGVIRWREFRIPEGGTAVRIALIATDERRLNGRYRSSDTQKFTMAQNEAKAEPKMEYAKLVLPNSLFPLKSVLPSLSNFHNKQMSKGPNVGETTYGE